MLGSPSYVTPEYTSTDAMIDSVQQAMTEMGLVQHGDRVVIVAGNPGRTARQTNSLRVYEMG